jgi:hypothetical protein
MALKGFCKFAVFIDSLLSRNHSILLSDMTIIYICNVIDDGNFPKQVGLLDIKGERHDGCEALRGWRKTSAILPKAYGSNFPIIPPALSIQMLNIKCEFNGMLHEGQLVTKNNKVGRYLVNDCGLSTNLQAGLAQQPTKGPSTPI